MYYIVDHNDMYYICTAAIQYRKQQVGNIGLMHLCLLPYCHTLFTLTSLVVFSCIFFIRIAFSIHYDDDDVVCFSYRSPLSSSALLAAATCSCIFLLANSCCKKFTERRKSYKHRQLEASSIS